MLSIRCPRCGLERTTRELKTRGLRCDGADCRVTLWELASESSRCWQPLTYLFVSEATGEVKYVGTTTNLPTRLIQHAGSDGKLMMGKEGRQPTEKGDRTLTPSDKKRWREHRNAEEKLAAAGVRVHVAFEATEWHHWNGSLWRGEDGRWRTPEWNHATPPKHEMFRSVRRQSVDTTVCTYKTPRMYAEDDGNHLRRAYGRLGDRTASALNLETSKQKFDPSAAAAAVHLCWHDRLVSSLMTDEWRTEYMSGELALPGVGALTVQRSVGVGRVGKTGRMKSQHEDARERVEMPGGRWPTLRQGACARCRFFGYCRCDVPCGQRWELVGEPEKRREIRRTSRATHAWWQDPWQRHGVMSSDDEMINDLAEEAMWLEGEMRRQKESGENGGNTHWPRINELTKAITALRERDFYGKAMSHGCYATLMEASWTPYLGDRAVRRVCAECEMNFANRLELAAHVHVSHVHASFLYR